MYIVLKRAGVLAKAIGEGEIINEHYAGNVFSCHSAEKKWLWGTRIALTEEEDFEDELEDLEYVQFFYTGSSPSAASGEVLFADKEFDEDGAECSVWDELSAYFDSAGEDFGPESPRHKKDNPYGRRHVAAAALGDMDFEVFLEEYQECFEFSPKVISGYADNDFEMNMEDDVLEKIDPSTFMGFTVEYEAHEIPDEYVRETEHGRRVDLDAFLKKYRTDMEEGKESILEEEHYAIGFAAMPGVREKKSGKRTA